MKIIARSPFSLEIKDCIKAEPSLCSLLNPDLHGYEFEIGTELFDKYLLAIERVKRIYFNLYMSFDDEDYRTAKYFKVDCRGKLLKETKKDRAYNAAEFDKLHFTKTGPRNRIKIGKRFSVSNIKLQQNDIGYIEYRGEYVISKYILELFKSEGLSGFTVHNIYDFHTQKNRNDFYLLASDSILPEAVPDISWRMITDPQKSQFDIFTIWGCLTYDNDLVSAKDFNRTAEGYAADFSPFLIVSEKVKSVYKTNSLKGWHFRPVLTANTKDYEKYIELWQGFLGKVAGKANIYLH